MTTRMQRHQAKQARIEQGLFSTAWLKDDSTGRVRKFYGTCETQAVARAMSLADKWYTQAKANGEQTQDRFYLATAGDGWSSLFSF